MEENRVINIAIGFVTSTTLVGPLAPNTEPAGYCDWGLGSSFSVEHELKMSVNITVR